MDSFLTTITNSVTSGILAAFAALQGGGQFAAGVQEVLRQGGWQVRQHERHACVFLYALLIADLAPSTKRSCNGRCHGHQTLRNSQTDGMSFAFITI